MKRILILIACICLICFAGCKDETSPSTGEVVESEKEKFESYQDLTDRFMEYCEAGDLEGVYSLYYDDLLTKTYERISDKVSKDEFEAGIIAEMQSVYSFEEFEYGCAEMPAMSSPLSYVNQLMYYSGGDPLEIEESRVTNCVDLRVYKMNSSHPSDHMMACIDGYWYFIV